MIDQDNIGIDQDPEKEREKILVQSNLGATHSSRRAHQYLINKMMGKLDKRKLMFI